MRIVFAGTPELAATVLTALLAGPHEVCAVYTQPDRPAGRGRHLVPGPVKVLAERHGLAVRQPASLKGPAQQAALAALAPELMVVAAYGLILPRSILDTPARGCVNVHASVLPRWRGAAPIQRAILAGDSETGVSIMQMDAGLDTGDVLHVARCPIADDDTAGALHDRLAALGADALLYTLGEIEAGRARPVPQPEAGVTYAPRLSKAEARVDWAKAALALAREVRAFDPWPVSHTTRAGEALRIWRARCVADSDAGAVPGTVLAASHEGVDVATGRGVLRILELQAPGARRMPAADYLNARPVMPGEVLGDAADAPAP